MTLADDRSSQRSYAGNENLTLSEADLSANDEPRPYAGGEKLRAYCPVHGGNNQRSLEVDLKTGRFFCHNCQAWGYMDWARENWKRERDGTPTGGRRERSQRPPVRRPPAVAPKPPEPVRENLDELAERFAEALPGSWGEKYLEHRDVALDLARRYGVGYAAPGEWPGRDWKGGRLIAPHSRPDGVTVNLYGRAVARGEVPKQRKHDHLPGNKGYWNARVLQEGEGPLYVTEGFLDALALIAAGCERTVAIFSARDWRWHWLPEDVRQLVLAFDSDDTGERAREDIAFEARLRGIEVAYLDTESYGGENDPAAAYTAGTLVVGEWSEPPAAMTVPEGPSTDPVAEMAPTGSAGEAPDPVPATDAPATEVAPDPDDREAAKVLYRLYEQDVRLDLGEGGKLRAGRDAGLTEVQRGLLRVHEAGLTHLVSDEATGAAFSPAMRYVSDALRRRGCANDSLDARRAVALLNAAQEAYEDHDHGLARYRLRQAALAAAGRLPE